MAYSLKIYSKVNGEIEKFLKLFWNQEFVLENHNLWAKNFENPVDMIDLITVFADNKDKFKANMWISLDKDVYIFIYEKNINSIVKYIYERFPY